MKSLRSGKVVPFLLAAALLTRALGEQAPDRAENGNSEQSTSDGGQQSTSDERVYEVSHGVTPPRPIYTPEPEYTNRARKKKVQGTVLVALVLTSEGQPRDVTVTKKLDPDLDNKAVEAVRSWTFETATKGGEPVAVHMQVEVSFRLY